MLFFRTRPGQPARPFALLAAVLGTACSSSPASPGVPDARADATHQDAGVVDSGSMDVNPCLADGYNAPGTPQFAVEAGTTWSSLYRDYFGPGGTASCSGGSNCHGSEAGAGFMSSGFLCPHGDAAAACWAGMTHDGDGGPNIVGDVSFNDGGLGTILCQNYCLGQMPNGCTYYFTPNDMARIAAWVSGGAKDD